MSPDNRIKLIKGLVKLLLLFNVLFRSLFPSLSDTLDTLCRLIYDTVHTRHDDRYKLNECCCYNFSASSPCRVLVRCGAAWCVNRVKICSQSCFNTFWLTFDEVYGLKRASWIEIIKFLQAFLPILSKLMWSRRCQRRRSAEKTNDIRNQPTFSEQHKFDSWCQWADSSSSRTLSMLSLSLSSSSSPRAAFLLCFCLI